jgi:tetratricopeptide (TPR) repeat protein
MLVVLTTVLILNILAITGCIASANTNPVVELVKKAEKEKEEGNIQLALEHLKEAEEIQGSFWHSYYSPGINIKIYENTAKIYEQEENIEEAIIYYRKMLPQMRENRKVRREYKNYYRDTLFKIASLYEKIGNKEKAEAYQDCAVRLCRDIY